MDNLKELGFERILNLHDNLLELLQLDNGQLLTGADLEEYCTLLSALAKHLK